MLGVPLSLILKLISQLKRSRNSSVFGLVMSSGDFVVLTRLDGLVQLHGWYAEQPWAPLSKYSQLTNQQSKCTTTNELTSRTATFLTKKSQFVLNAWQMRNDDCNYIVIFLSFLKLKGKMCCIFSVYSIQLIQQFFTLAIKISWGKNFTGGVL